MVRPRDRLQACTGFQWDEGNATKNWDRHDVSQAECEDVFFNRPLVIRRDKRHSAAEARHYALGRTDTDRLLFVCFTIRADRIRVISARDMTPGETERYES
jgi:uncharacterized DUF497 family protein